jgi:hypothetical protein
MATTSTVLLRNAMIAALQANLPPLAAAQNLAPVVEFLPYEPGLLLPNKAPQVWLTVSESRPQGPAAAGGGNAVTTRARRVLIGVTSAGPDQQRAETELYAYADLIQALVFGDQTAAGQGTRVIWLGTAYGRNMSGNATALFKPAVLTFDVQRWSALGSD